MSFPKDFLWGGAIAANQYEGACMKVLGWKMGNNQTLQMYL